MTLRKALALAIGITITGSGAAFAGTAPLSDTEIDRVSAQGIQTILNESFNSVADQNNNLDSVQLNDFAQESSIVEGLVNSAVSAVNASANVLHGSETTASEVTQANFNLTSNHHNNASTSFSNLGDNVAQNLDKQTQYVENGSLATIDEQNNNNNSVQLNDSAQRNSQGVNVMNSSFSSNNFGLNIFSSDDINGGALTQVNNQFSVNMPNIAEFGINAFANNYESGGVTQWIVNDSSSDIASQVNNDNSVQVNSYAQQNALADSIVNTAKSATNGAANLATVDDIDGANISQINVAGSDNHRNSASALNAYAWNLNKQTQNIENGSLLDTLAASIRDQDNNNNSVQVNGKAQQNVSAVLLENSAGSAVSAVLNLLDAGEIGNSQTTISQENTLRAENYNNSAGATGQAFARNRDEGASPGQYVGNNYATIYDQDNNNNSVQLNDNAQQNVTVDKLINSANSAVNVGQNLLNWDGPNGGVNNSNISQNNSEVAFNHKNFAFSSASDAVAANDNKQTQVVVNYFTTDLSQGTQDNNMNSVQLNDFAQQFASALVLVNSAASAVNSGLNVINAGTVIDSGLTQTNRNTALNFFNEATGYSAFAINNR